MQLPPPTKLPSSLSSEFRCDIYRLLYYCERADRFAGCSALRVEIGFNLINSFINSAKGAIYNSTKKKKCKNVRW